MFVCISEEVEEESITTCSHGHRSSLILQTLDDGGDGGICLLCFAALVSDPSSPTVHVSFALSSLSRALTSADASFHAHLLVSPLVGALSAFGDPSIASLATDLISDLCSHAAADSSVFGDFVRRISDQLSSAALAWSSRQVYTLHCLGILLNCSMSNPYVHIRDKDALVSKLVAGLQLPSDEIRGEILFVLYKLAILQTLSMDDDGYDILLVACPKILRLSLEALMKTSSDDVRLNCVALLSVLAQRGFFLKPISSDLSAMNFNEAEKFMLEAEDGRHEPTLSILFAEAIKGSLLSSDSKVQISTLDLIFHYLSWEGASGEQTLVLIEENIPDFIFEILRLSECKDPLVNSCLQVLDLLSRAEKAFRRRLAIGFTTLVPVLHYVAEVPFHPVQHQTLKLIWNCTTSCPGIISISHMEELGLVLTKMLKIQTDGELGMLPETFNIACSIFVALIKSPSSHGSSNLVQSVQEASKVAVLACISVYNKYPSQFLYSLYLLKEAYAFSCECSTNDSDNVELGNFMLDICSTILLPWLQLVINEMEEDVVLGVMETFHSILLQESNLHAKEFASTLVSSSWFCLAFGCLGLFPTEKVKWNVYLMFSSIVEVLLGNESGQPIRDAALYLPSDPIDLLFLLGQQSCQNQELLSCQSAVLLIYEICSLYDVKLADEKLILASLEQYILVNNDVLSRATNLEPLKQLVNLYGLYRGLTKIDHQIPQGSEAERILFQLMMEKHWELFCTKIHLTALKWLFQQEKIIKTLSHQILQFCKSSSSFDNHIVIHGKDNPSIDIREIAQLVATGDNFGAKIFIYLLGQLLEEGEENDIISVVNFMAEIINMFPSASDQLCLQGMGNTALNLMYHLNHFSSQKTLTAILVLIFNILHSVHPELLNDDKAWLGVVMKLIEVMIPTVAEDNWSQEAILGIGVLCLILHHSTIAVTLHHATDGVLVEAAKMILLNSTLISVVQKTINTGCPKGAVLVDHNEGTGTAGPLTVALLLNFFSLKSLNVVLPKALDWQTIFNPSEMMQPFSVISIPCNDLCRMMHFGSPLVKLVSSYCLVELFTSISDQKNENDELNCSMGYLKSLIAVFEGLIFHGDHRVALNCGLCISMILSWEKLGMQNAKVPGAYDWCRLIAEELAISLAVPCLASKSFMNHHKPAIHVTVALFKLEKVPEWMKSVFDYSCISGIIKNISATDISTEMVVLFRELLKSQCLKVDHIASINRVLQACRRHMYIDSAPNDSVDECIGKVDVVPDDSRNIYEFLISLMTSESRVQTQNERLLEEIETYFRCLTEVDGAQEVC